MTKRNAVVSFRHINQIAIELITPKIIGPVMEQNTQAKVFAATLLIKPRYCFGLPKGMIACQLCYSDGLRFLLYH